MAELADAKDLGSFTVRRAGSTPVTRINKTRLFAEACFVMSGGYMIKVYQFKIK